MIWVDWCVLLSVSWIILRLVIRLVWLIMMFFGLVVELEVYCRNVMLFGVGVGKVVGGVGVGVRLILSYCIVLVVKCVCRLLCRVKVELVSVRVGV